MNVRELIAELIKLPMDMELRNEDGIPVCNINTNTSGYAAYIIFNYPEGYHRDEEIRRVAELPTDVDEEEPDNYITMYASLTDEEIEALNQSREDRL